MADTITKIKYLVKDSTAPVDYDTSRGKNIFYGGTNIEKIHLSDNLTGEIRGFLVNGSKIE